MANRVDRIAAECLAVRLRRLNRQVTRIYDNALRPFGAKVSQLNILVAAAKMGETRPADICGCLDLDASTLSRNLERMRRRGWIETLSDEHDARAQPFRVTDQGKGLIEETYPAWRDAQKAARKLLGADAADALLAA